MIVPPLRGYCLLVAAAAILLTEGCADPMSSSHTPPRDINSVLADHQKDLMGMAGVVGIYVGVLPDQRTPCLKVMLARHDPALERKIPRTLEGYRVVSEITGEIRPMK